MQHLYFDTLIIGSGLAGFTLALNLANNQKIGLITKQSYLDGASGRAQGGIAAALSKDDSSDKHIHDTLIAGAGLCNETTVHHVIENGPQAIEWLINQGVSFTRDKNNDTGYHLTQEGGHGIRRVIHTGDATGKAVQQTGPATHRDHSEDVGGQKIPCRYKRRQKKGPPAIAGGPSS